MTESLTEAGAERFEVRATADRHFGWFGTRLSLEGSLLSWVRTAVALIGFGFAIVQYFNHLQQMPRARPAYLPTAPEYLGLALISCGILALLISIQQYRWGLRYLSSGSFASIAGLKKGEIQTPVLAVAVLLVFIGLFAFFAVLFRLA